jgi:adenylate cyclase
MDLAEYEALGLYEPTAPDADERLELLEWFEARGISLEQMVRARDRFRLRSAAGDALLRPGTRLTVDEVADRAGMSVDQIVDLSLSVGLPYEKDGDPVHTEADVEVFKLFNLGAEVFPRPSLRQFVRVLGWAMSRIADAAVALFLSDVETRIVESRGRELEHAKAQVEAIEALNTLPEVMNTLFRAHMEVAIERNQAARAEATSLVTVFLAVGFVDLVGFTSFSRQVPVAELGSAISEFEDVAYGTVASHDGRVVKLIGDEVMFVALEPQAACQIALSMVEHFSGDASGVTPRGGIAVGEVLTRGGDYYGPVVNLASRICDLAVPSEVLVTSELRERAESPHAAIAFAPAGRRMLKGYDDPVELFAVRREAGRGTR